VPKLWNSLAAGLRQTDIGYEQFKRLLKTYLFRLLHVVVVIAQQLFSYRQLSRLRKSVTAAGLSHRSCTVSCVGTVEQMFYGVWCHSTLRTDIGYAAGDAGLVCVQELTGF